MKAVINIVFFIILIFFTSCTNPNIEEHDFNLEDIVYVSAGNASSFTIQRDGTLWVWGANSSGQHGNNESSHFSVPGLTYTMIMDNVRSVSANGSGAVSGLAGHVLAIKDDDTLWGWGNNEVGQLGIVTYGDNQLYPAQIMEDVLYAFAGASHSAVIKNDNALWMFGCNCSGKLGDGTSLTISANPIHVMDDAVAVSLGFMHTAVIKSDGSLYVWGSNEYGQIGNGTKDDSLLPVKIMDDVIAVSTGLNFTIAITSDNVLWGWGNNYFG